MSASDSQPRPRQEPRTWVIYQDPKEGARWTLCGPLPEWGTTVEVIEKSAYDALKAEFEGALTAQGENLRKAVVQQHRAQTAEASLTACREALKRMLAVTQLPGTRAAIAPEMERAKTLARTALASQQGPR